MQTTLTTMKIKYTELPNAARPTGQTCDTIMEPIEPPEAAKLRPLARTAVGKIYEVSKSAISASALETPRRNETQ